MMVEVPAAAHRDRTVRRGLLLDRLATISPNMSWPRRATSTRSQTSTTRPIPPFCGLSRRSRPTAAAIGTKSQPLRRRRRRAEVHPGSPERWAAGLVRCARRACRDKGGHRKHRPSRRASDERRVEPQRRADRHSSRPTRRSCSNVLDQRPSGTRQRLATALGKNRSFIIANLEPRLSGADPGARISRSFSRSAIFRRLRSAPSSTPSRVPIPIGTCRSAADRACAA